jgi:hypothetical protein
MVETLKANRTRGRGDPRSATSYTGWTWPQEGGAAGACAALNDDGRASSTGRPWTATMVRDLLSA